MMKKFFIAFLFVGSLSVLFASRWSDKAFYIVETEPAKEIKRAIATDYSFKNYRRGSEKENLLMAALKNDRANDVITVLLKAGISPDSKTKQGVTAFMYACQYETDMDAVWNMLKTKAFTNSSKRRRILRRDKNGLTSFDYARMNETHSEQVLEILLEYADEPERPQEETDEEEPEEVETEETAPVEEVETEETIPVEESAEVSAVTEAPAPAAEEEPVIENKIIDFSHFSAPKIVRESIYLYDYADVAVPAMTIPAVLIAAEEASRSFIPDANVRDSNGRTKLMIAAKSGDIMQIENLLYSGAEIDAKDADGWTALMYAARFQKNPAVTQLLLYKGADRSLKNNYGLTPLMLSAGYAENSGVVAALLDSYPADSDEAREAFSYGIANYNKTTVLQAFVDKRVPLNIPYDGKTPLMLACQTNKNTNIIEWLLENGASKYQIEAETGKTAYDYAKENHKLPHNVVYWSLNPNS